MLYIKRHLNVVVGNVILRWYYSGRWPFIS